MRTAVTLMMIATGVVIMAVSYLYLAAPWGFPPDSVRFSNPLVPFAPAIFVIGFMVLFLAAVVYEILPERENE